MSATSAIAKNGGGRGLMDRVSRTLVYYRKFLLGIPGIIPVLVRDIILSNFTVKADLEM